MARITRRKLLKVTGAGAVAAKTGGLAAILATGRAPAYAQATTVHWLRWNDFVPACDQLLRQKILPDFDGVPSYLRKFGANAIGQRLRVVGDGDFAAIGGKRIRRGDCSGYDFVFLLNNNEGHDPISDGGQKIPAAAIRCGS